MSFDYKGEKIDRGTPGKELMLPKLDRISKDVKSKALAEIESCCTYDHSGSKNGKVQGRF